VTVASGGAPDLRKGAQQRAASRCCGATRLAGSLGWQRRSGHCDWVQGPKGERQARSQSQVRFRPGLGFGTRHPLLGTLSFGRILRRGPHFGCLPRCRPGWVTPGPARPGPSNGPSILGAAFKSAPVRLHKPVLSLLATVIKGAVP
jgi:hypothetical protein